MLLTSQCKTLPASLLLNHRGECHYPGHVLKSFEAAIAEKGVLFPVILQRIIQTMEAIIASEPFRDVFGVKNSEGNPLKLSFEEVTSGDKRMFRVYVVTADKTSFDINVADIKGVATIKSSAVTLAWHSINLFEEEFDVEDYEVAITSFENKAAGVIIDKGENLGVFSVNDPAAPRT